MAKTKKKPKKPLKWKCETCKGIFNDKQLIHDKGLSLVMCPKCKGKGRLSPIEPAKPKITEKPEILKQWIPLYPHGLTREAFYKLKPSVREQLLREKRQKEERELKEAIENKPKPERIKQKLRELETEKKQVLSQFEKPIDRPSRKCELTQTEITLSFAIILSVSLLALFCGIYPNLYGLAFCVITLSLLVFTIIGKLLKLHKQFL